MNKEWIQAPLNGTHKGPPLGMLAIVYVVLFAVSTVIMPILTHGAPMPMPYGPAELSRHYYLQFPDALRINAWLQFGSIIPLGIFTAAITSRLKFLGINASGVNIALFGGIGASLFLGFSGLASWVQSQPGISNDIGSMRVVQLSGFFCGGVAHVVLFGLLLAGVSVTARFRGLISSGLFWFGMITAAFAELSSLSIIFPILSIFIPLGRYPGFIWMIIVGFKLPLSVK
ncbi:MAG TPA: hypothetical protein VGM24_13340 [Puia sp.]